MTGFQVDSNIKFLTGLIGSPVSHSLSPEFHRSLFKLYNMNNHDYVLIDSAEKGIEKTLRSLDKRFIGFNVTMPDKENILPFLDEISDEVKDIKAVNTVKIQNGKMTGFNTDGKGFLNALRKKGVCVKNKKVIIYGCGGAAKAISFELKREGAEIKMLHRPDDEELNESLSGADIFINASPVGMNKVSSPVKNLEPVKKDIFIADLIYRPEKTKLLLMADEKKLKNMNGMDMLIEQAKISFFIWHGIKVL